MSAQKYEEAPVSWQRAAHNRKFQEASCWLVRLASACQTETGYIGRWGAVLALTFALGIIPTGLAETSQEPIGEVENGGELPNSLELIRKLQGNNYGLRSAEGGDVSGAVRSVADYEYSIHDNKATITGYAGTDEDITIPSSIDGYPVISIGDDAFYECSGLTSVVIPNSVISIGDGAFDSCSGLTSVVIPNSVISIGEEAFAYCSGLTSVTIPDSVTSIGGWAFEGCSGFTSVTIPTSVTSIGEGAFAYCSGLTSAAVLTSVTSIEAEMFRDCSELADVTLPNSVTSIGDEAFEGCSSLTSVTIPNGVTSIGDGAFYNCSSLAVIYFVGTPPATKYWTFGGVPGTAYYISGTDGWETEFGDLPTAVWTSEVTFDGNGGTPSFASRNYNVGNAYGELPTAKRPGYVFAGWWTALGDDGTPVTVDTQVPLLTSGHALYAKWSACPQHLVIFDLGGLSTRNGGGELQQSVTEGMAAEAPQLTVEPGWSFEGWDSEFQNITGPTIIRAVYSYAHLLHSGWNLIAAKLNLNEESQDLLLNKAAMTLDANSRAYACNGKLAVTQACWIYCRDAEKIILSGTTPEEADFEASLKPGWNFVGPLSYRSLADSGLIAWGWNGQRFYPTASLLAGHGYWVYWPGGYVAPPEDAYLIVDLSAGADAESYPVSYRSTPPAYGWTDECKTTKLVLRKIPAGSFMMGSSEIETGHGPDEAMHQVTLSKDYYLAVFELTRKQWELVMGGVPGAALGDLNPLDQASWDDIRGGVWPGLPAGNGLPADFSFMETLRARTGLNFDLPTEAQWEYACRAGTASALNSGKDLEAEEACANLDLLANYGRQNDGPLPPGRFLPNAWGLYDMHGNLSEWCLDQHGEYSGQLYDPLGGDAEPEAMRVLRGGDWRSSAAQCRAAARAQAERGTAEAGIRLCLLHNPEISTVTGVLTGVVQAGVTVCLAGDLDRQTVTGADGRYTFADLPAGNYTITPELDGYAFVPSGASVTVPMTYAGSLDFTVYAGSRADTRVQVATGATINHADNATQIIIPAGALRSADDTGEIQVTSAALSSPLTGLAPGNEAIAGTAVLELPSSAILVGGDQVIEFRVPLLPATRSADPAYNLTMIVVEVYDNANPSKRYTQELFGAYSENQTRSGIMSIFCMQSTLLEIQRDAQIALGAAAIKAKTAITASVVSVKEQFTKAMDWGIKLGINIYNDLNVNAFIARWDPNGWEDNPEKGVCSLYLGKFVKRGNDEDLTDKRVVVFLHGWQALAGWWKGFDTGLLYPHVTTWERLARYATQKWGSKAQREQYAYYSVRYDSDKDIFDNAVNIRRLLAEEFPDKQIIIIAHSMGGMISRAMLTKYHPEGKAFAEWPNGGIERIISLNTPYHGTPFVQIVHEGMVATEFALDKAPLLSTGILAFLYLTTPGTLCLAWDNYDANWRIIIPNLRLRELNQLGGNDSLPQYYTFGTTIAGAKTRGEWLLTNVSGKLVASCGYSNDGIVPKESAHLRGTGNAVRTVEMGGLPHGKYNHTKVYTGHGINKDDPNSYDKVLYDEILGCLIPETLPEVGEYLVVDLSAGPSASRYPVSILPTAPAGGWADEYKTTKLVLRRIPAGTFMMGAQDNELGRYGNETQHQVTLTKDFYVGVFEVTQKQWERLMGDWPSWFSNAAYCDTRPVEKVSYEDIRGGDAGSGWPVNNAVDADSFLGRLRAKTGLTFDLPTEAQWEYACRAGTKTALNSGKNLTNAVKCPNMAEVGRYWYNGGADRSEYGDTSSGTAKIGSYLPNQWGVYDMHGNVWEWCLDWYQSELGSVVQTDPHGAAGGAERLARGGGWSAGADGCRSACRGRRSPSDRCNFLGFRLALTDQ